MKEVNGTIKGDSISLKLSGRIDSGNAQNVKEAIFAVADQLPGAPVVVDAEELEYISSAGLRVLLQLRKNHSELRITDVGSDVYEILDMTGFTQMMTVEKAYRKVCVEGCEVIGQGANGTIYRIDKDNVVKVYNDPDSLDDIQNEREVARLALVLGIPTAISYDVVRVGDSYGSVFELLNARSFAKILRNEPDQLDWCVQESVRLLEKIHRTVVPKGKLPDMKERALDWALFMQDHLPEEAGKKLVCLMEAVPDDDHMIHGDYHVKNIELTDEEVLLIDMDTLAVGHPVFELASMYNAYIGFSEYEHEQVERFLGFDRETAIRFWKRSLQEYLGTDYEPWVQKVEDQARVIGYTRLIRRSIRRGGLEDEKRREEIRLWKDNLLELLGRVDSLVFSRDEIEVEAKVENLQKVIEFVENRLDGSSFFTGNQMQLEVAIEEIFVNISSYAYAPDTGKACVRVMPEDSDGLISIIFEDSGIPYDPLAKEDPDISLPAEEREIGGLGVLLVKRFADQVGYEYKDGKNILTLKKQAGKTKRME